MLIKTKKKYYCDTDRKDNLIYINCMNLINSLIDKVKDNTLSDDIIISDDEYYILNNYLYFYVKEDDKFRQLKSNCDKKLIYSFVYHIKNKLDELYVRIKYGTPPINRWGKYLKLKDMKKYYDNNERMIDDEKCFNLDLTCITTPKKIEPFYCYEQNKKKKKEDKKKEDKKEEEKEIKNIEFGEKLGEGTYGVVYMVTLQFKNDDKQYEYAAKTYKKGEEYDKEKKILSEIKKIYESNKDITVCSGLEQIKNWFFTEYEKNIYLIMDKYDGELDDIIYDISYEQKYNISVKIINLFLCLYKNNMYFTDIKTQNLLYRLNKFKSYDVCITDFGSFVHIDTSDDNNIEYVYTIQPKSKSTNLCQGKCKLIDVQKVSLYGLGYLLIKLAFNNDKKYDDVRNILRCCEHKKIVNNKIYYIPFNKYTNEEILNSLDILDYKINSYLEIIFIFAKGCIQLSLEKNDNINYDDIIKYLNY